MLLRQSFKGGTRDYRVLDLKHASSIVALLNIAYSMAKKSAISGLRSVDEAMYVICEEHELHGVLRDMFRDFGDCIFTLVMPSGEEYVMNPDFIQFEKPVEITHPTGDIQRY